MVVSWNSPPSEDQNGIIMYYLLLITQEQFNISDRVINTISNATSYIVANLEEYNNYTCRVAAATRIGPGPYSAPIYFNTPEDGMCYCITVSITFPPCKTFVNKSNLHHVH